ncbi:hypothetical protein ARMSODRAFT_1024963 [Armillaria solidipes]|uniref:Uncharacterized protein n=1 Tax=Armillaria solidipes TaxID=1076256 RepID=A0A2H3AUF9_9AGAR|nr:hypothetical protein ARMSODRAFT_1024963 [Armillaria solidipes]
MSDIITWMRHSVMNLETPAGRKHQTYNGKCNQTQNLKAGSSESSLAPPCGDYSFLETQVTPRQPTPCFPTQPFTIPFHYVPRTTGRTELPPLFPSQSTGLSSLVIADDSSRIHTEQEELDLGEEGRRVLYSEYQEIPAITNAGLSEELQRIPAVIAGSTTTVPSSPEFPTCDSITGRTHDIASDQLIVIDTDSEAVSDYILHSPTSSEYNVWLKENDLTHHTSDRLPR